MKHTGDNSYGQLGTEDVESSSRLIQIEGLENIVEISAGENYGLALNAYGTVYGWGINDVGQLGEEKIREITKTPTQLELDIGDIVSIELPEMEGRDLISGQDVSGAVRLNPWECAWVKLNR